MADIDPTERRIREERAKVYDGMVAVMDKVREEKRDLTVEERTDFDAREARLQELDEDLKRVTAYNKRSAASKELADTRGTSEDEASTKAERESRAFTAYLRRGVEGVPADLRGELRTTNDPGGLETVPAQGGYMIPQGFWHNLQIAMKAYGGIEELMNSIETPTGNLMPWPTNNPTAVVGTWLGATSGVETQGTQLGFQDYAFGQGQLHAWTVSSNIITASLQAIQDSAFPIDSFVSDRAAESIGRAIAQALITGTGPSAGQPTGIVPSLVAFTRVDSGGVYQGVERAVQTLTGSVASKLTSGLVDFQDLLTMIRYVDPAYRSGARWVLSDTTLQNLRSVTDQYGHPLWQPSVAQGSPDTLYDYPLTLDQNVGAVSTTASTAGGLLFGNFKPAHVVRRVTGGSLMRLTERYADFLQVGFLAFCRMDAQPNDLRAAVVYESPAS